MSAPPLDGSDVDPLILPDGLSRRRAVSSAFAAYVTTVVAIAALDQLAGLSSFILANLQVIAAAMFLYLPSWLLRRQGCDALAYGLHGDRPLAQLGLAAALMAVVFPMFVAGYHGWQVLVLGHHASLDREVVDRWPRELEDRPPLPPQRPFTVWDERGILNVYWGEATTASPVEATVSLDVAPEAAQASEVRDAKLFTRALSARGAVRREPSEPNVVKVTGHTPGGVRVEAHRATSVTIELRRGGRVPPADDVGLGGYQMSSDDAPPLHFERGWLWLLTLVLVQILVVGLPEEVFYRGFLQPRLELIWPPRLRILGAPWGFGVVATSVLFALGHYLVDWNPGRLAVFFPSLLFGWIRNRSGSVAAGAVFHGMSNVLLAVVSRAYIG